METDRYTRVSRRELYRNQWLGVEAHEIVHPNGVPGEHVLVVTPRASAVVVEVGGDLLFTRQPRFGARCEVIEIVKGGRDAGESALECAKRELREELGLHGGRWEPLGKVYEIPSIVSDPVDLFIASELDSAQREPESQESIETVALTARAAIDAALTGAIDDAVTIAALLRYAIARGLLVHAPTLPRQRSRNSQSSP